MLKYLKKRLAKLTAKRDALSQRALASQDATEVRSLGEQIADINEEIADIQEQITESEAEEQRSATPPAEAEIRNAGIVASFAQNAAPQQRSEENVLDSMEYRTAFRDYIQRGTPIPAALRERVNALRMSDPQLRAGDAITTNETGVLIPHTIIREIINTVRTSYGALYDKIRKTSRPGGVEYPIGDFDAEFTWITESTVSVEKSLDGLTTVSFGYNVAELRIAQTFLSALLSLDAFEGEISKVIAQAYRKMMDTGIVRGTGKGQMLGIINDTRVTNVITMTAAELNNWKKWEEKFNANLAPGYEDGDFIMARSTCIRYLKTMSDANNRPIYTETTGLQVYDGNTGKPHAFFMGHEMDFVQPSILPDFDTANSGDVFAIFWQPDLYIANENFGFTVKKYYDEDRNKHITKSLTVVDGKLLVPNGVVLIKKA
jgi:HK97 family phage major capsid protein